MIDADADGDVSWLRGPTIRRYVALLAATAFGSGQGDAAARRQA